MTEEDEVSGRNPGAQSFRVAVLVLNYNGVRWLRTCLPSLLHSAARGFGIFVVDNGSTDGSLEYVRSHFPQFGILSFDSNLGFAKGYNEAMKLVSADYVVLLNNDTAILSNDWIDHLVKLIERDSSVAAVQCKLVSFADHKKLDSVGVMGERYWQGFSDIGRSETDKKQYDLPPITPFAISGAGALVRRSTFLEVGGFDSKFFAYDEDVDLSWRFRLAGYRLVYQPLARVAHARLGSFGLSPDAFQTYLIRRNLLRMLMKNCGQLTFRWALRNYLILSCLMFFGHLVMRDRKALALVKALLWNIVYFKDTYAKRLEIQPRRKCSEEAILRYMFPNFAYHPLQHERLRRTLDAVFAKGVGMNSWIR
jgi:hypothetical protein